MKNKILLITLTFFITTLAYSKTCRVADTIINSTQSDYLPSEGIKLELNNRDIKGNYFQTLELKERYFQMVELKYLKRGDFVFKMVHTRGINGRTKFGLSNCLLTGLIGLATFDKSRVECQIPDDVLQVTTVQLTRIEKSIDGEFEFEVVNEFDVETEWDGPHLPGFERAVSKKSMFTLLPCSYY